MLLGKDGIPSSIIFSDIDEYDILTKSGGKAFKPFEVHTLPSSGRDLPTKMFLRDFGTLTGGMYHFIMRPKPSSVFDENRIIPVEFCVRFWVSVIQLTAAHRFPA